MISNRKSQNGDLTPLKISREEVQNLLRSFAADPIHNGSLAPLMAISLLNSNLPFNSSYVSILYAWAHLWVWQRICFSIRPFEDLDTYRCLQSQYLQPPWSHNLRIWTSVWRLFCSWLGAELIWEDYKSDLLSRVIGKLDLGETWWYRRMNRDVFW